MNRLSTLLWERRDGCDVLMGPGDQGAARRHRVRCDQDWDAREEQGEVCQAQTEDRRTERKYTQGGRVVLTSGLSSRRYSRLLGDRAADGSGRGHRLLRTQWRTVA